MFFLLLLLAASFFIVGSAQLSSDLDLFAFDDDDDHIDNDESNLNFDDTIPFSSEISMFDNDSELTVRETFFSSNDADTRRIRMKKKKNLFLSLRRTTDKTPLGLSSYNLIAIEEETSWPNRLLRRTERAALYRKFRSTSDDEGRCRGILVLEKPDGRLCQYSRL